MGRAFLKPELQIITEMMTRVDGPGGQLIARGEAATKIANAIGEREFKYKKPSYPFAPGTGPHYAESWSVMVDAVGARLGVKLLNTSKGGIFAEQGRPSVTGSPWLTLKMRGGGFRRVRKVRSADGHSIIERALRIAYGS